MSFACPRCGVGLLVGQVAGATLHGCGRCGGIFVDTAVAHRIANAGDPAALALADQAARAATSAVDVRAPVACPACQAPCGRELVACAGVEVDACPAHGTWFDRGELQAIAASLAQWRAAGAGAPRPAGAPVAAPGRAPAGLPRAPAYGAGAVAVGAAAGVALAGGAAVALAANDPTLVERARRAVDAHGAAAADGLDVAADVVDVGDAAVAGAELVAGGAEVAAEVGFSLFGVIGELLGALAD
ncbi:MAG: zf-TFIIB domain-containing protein [Polyangiaceae bacterium]|nr:zf-TFIIB domain-containing protein [Polyangiaceae bacterium]